MTIDILTLFPKMVDDCLSESIIGRARAAGLVDIICTNIRDYSVDKHRRVDDYPYGGGCGMVMTPQPIYDAYMSIAQKYDKKPFVIYLTPQGRQYNQKIAKELAAYEHIILLCGHYEGVDERVIEEIVDMELSIGVYVLTGGEIAAMAVTDSIVRMLPGVLSSEQAFCDETHYNGLLEYPQYTRPPEFMGRQVPEVLLSGHHANIEKWQKEQSIERTRLKRPDLLEEM